MNCPVCGKRTRVWWTDKYDNFVQRTRICKDCNICFQTIEEVDEGSLKFNARKEALEDATT